MQDALNSIKIDEKKSGYITNNGYVDIVMQQFFNHLKKIFKYSLHESVDCYLNDEMDCKVKVWLEPVDNDSDHFYICGQVNKYQEYFLQKLELDRYPAVNSRLQINRGLLWSLLTGLAMIFVCRRLLS